MRKPKPKRPKLQDALAAHRRGDLATAERAYRRILKAQPGHPEASHLWGLVALQRGDPVTAATRIEAAVRAVPKQAIYLANLGEAYSACARWKRAIDVYRQALSVEPASMQAMNGLALALLQTGERASARRTFEAAIAAGPAPQAHYNLGNMLRAEGAFGAALEHYHLAVELDPQHHHAWLRLAEVAERRGELDRAEKAIGYALALEPGSSQARIVAAQIALRRDDFGGAQEHLRGVDPQTLPADADRAIVMRLLGSVHDGLGEYELAFECFVRAKSYQPEAPVDDPMNGHGAIERYRRWFDARRLGAWSEAPVPAGPDPIFLVGFPRSGTTLLESILASHSRVGTVSEQPTLEEAQRKFLLDDLGLARLNTLTPQQQADWRSRYWTEVRRHTDAPVVVDKMPLRLLYLGLVQRLFPRAKVIVAIRDPRDACLSAFFQTFRERSGVAHLVSLDETTRYYEACMGLFLHYTEGLRLQTYMIRYEDLLGDFHEQTQALVEFLGLEWEPALQEFHRTARDISTPSYAQVTRPLYNSSVGRWRNYMGQFAPYRERLRPFVEAFGYPLQIDYNESSDVHGIRDPARVA